jgi:hypothetical protein
VRVSSPPDLFFFDVIREFAASHFRYCGCAALLIIVG